MNDGRQVKQDEGKGEVESTSAQRDHYKIVMQISIIMHMSSVTSALSPHPAATLPKSAPDAFLQSPKRLLLLLLLLLLL